MRRLHRLCSLVMLPLVIPCGGCFNKDAVMRDVYASRAGVLRKWELERHAPAGRYTLRGPLSLEECVRVALANSKMLAAAFQERERAKGRILEGYSVVLPQLSFNASYTRLKDVPSFTAGPESIVVGDYDNYSYGLTFRQPVMSGAIRPTLRAATVYSSLADQTVRGARQRVIFNAMKAYYDVLLARALLEVANQSLKTAQTHLEETRKRRKQGLASDYDVLRSSVQVSNQKARQIQSKNRLHLAESALYKAMGVSQESRAVLTGKLEYEDEKVDLGAAVRSAIFNRPELLQSELAVRLQRELLSIARAGWWPNLFAVVNYQRAKPSPVDITLNEWDDQLSAGVSLEIPLFDGLGTLGRVKQAKAELKRHKIELSDAEEGVLLEVRQAILSLQDAAELVQSQQANLERAREGLRLVTARYRNGMSTQVEVMDAQTALVAAQGIYYQAIYEHMLARLRLEKAMGALAPPGVTRTRDAGKSR